MLIRYLRSWARAFSYISITIIQCSFMSGSCHLDRVWNVEIWVECQIFVIVIFFNCGWVLKFGAHSRYYKGALIQRDHFQWFVLLSNLIFMSAEKIKTKNNTKYKTLWKMEKAKAIFWMYLGGTTKKKILLGIKLFCFLR